MIQTFNIEPYPKKLWVAKNEDWEKLYALTATETIRTSLGI